MSLQVKVHILISYLWLRNLLDFDLFLDFPRIIAIFTPGIKLQELFTIRTTQTYRDKIILTIILGT